MIKLKTKEDIENLKISGQKLANIVDEVAQNIKPGISTQAEDCIRPVLPQTSGNRPQKDPTTSK